MRRDCRATDGCQDRGFSESSQTSFLLSSIEDETGWFAFVGSILARRVAQISPGESKEKCPFICCPTFPRTADLNRPTLLVSITRRSGLPGAKRYFSFCGHVKLGR